MGWRRPVRSAESLPPSFEDCSESLGTSTFYSPKGISRPVNWQLYLSRSVCRRDTCLTTYKTHKKQTSMPSAGFEPEIPAIKRPQTRALDRAATDVWLYRCKLAGETRCPEVRIPPATSCIIVATDRAVNITYTNVTRSHNQFQN